MPLVTEYESQYGPPQFAHEPIEITYFGSGIWSYRRLTTGAILSVSVPATTIRSACRGPCANGITPNRMKSCLAVEAAMNSIEQHASPKLNTHSEYRRPQLRMNLIGWISPRGVLSITPTGAPPCAKRTGGRRRGSR